MPATITANEQKFKELIIYVASKCQTDASFGAIKLNKILFHADFLAYGSLGTPITGMEYMKLEHGPAPRLLAPIRADMQKDHDIVVVNATRFGFQQDRVVPLREPNLSLFSAEEIALVDSAIQSFWGVTATDLSEVTHGYRGWLMANRLKEIIPYQAVFLSDEPPTAYEIQHAHELIREHEWDL
jgi:hypothetical protein